MSSKLPGPQHSRLFKIIAFLTRLQVGYRVRATKNPAVVITLFTVTAGALALGILTIMAYYTKLPLVFPPLAATAFLLFYHPMAERSCPRNVIISHMIALIAGLFSLILFNGLFPESNILNAWVMCWPRVGANAMAMALAFAGMILLKCPHAPAAVTALIASTGYIVKTHQVLGFMGAVFFLVLEAFILLRLMGGIPYPLWNYDPSVAEDYKELADVKEGKTFWQRYSSQTFLRR
jgi:CBS-domain-containing membrane protein